MPCYRDFACANFKVTARHSIDRSFVRSFAWRSWVPTDFLNWRRPPQFTQGFLQSFHQFQRNDAFRLDVGHYSTDLDVSNDLKLSERPKESSEFRARKTTCSSFAIHENFCSAPPLIGSILPISRMTQVWFSLSNIFEMICGKNLSQTIKRHIPNHNR